MIRSRSDCYTSAKYCFVASRPLSSAAYTSDRTTSRQPYIIKPDFVISHARSLRVSETPGRVNLRNSLKPLPHIISDTFPISTPI